ncbi:MAG: DNA polymerase IV [Ruminococcaceae bacterium]|nr:DNA polymerase IV [Oscillospiraceae bacterium]
MQTHTRTILHCDLNNYFASVECLRLPQYKNIPMIVGGSVEDRHGIVLAKNEPAKKFGIRTGETIWQAKTKCPDLAVLDAHCEDYVRYSRQVRQIYSEYTDQVESMGIDECWLDVTASEGLFGSGAKIAEELRERVKRETGLTISVGVSFNKVFAKLGSDMKKPDAVTLIPYEHFREIVWPLPACEMLGVGMKTYKKIYYRGCRTIGDIANMRIELLHSWLGKTGDMLWAYANGLENSRVMWQTESEPIKSIGHGTTTRADLENETEVACVIRDLSEEIGQKLRLNHLKASGVAVQIRENDMTVREYQSKMRYSTQLAKEIAGEAVAVFRRKHLWHRPIRSVSVRAIYIRSENADEQMDMLYDYAAEKRLLELERTVDSIRDRFGGRSITSGSTLYMDGKLSAKRIGFGSTEFACRNG